VPDVNVTALGGEPREEIDCPLCGARKPAREFVARDRLFWRPGTYDIVRCADCSMRYVSPRPTLEALGAHYPEDYFIYKKPEDEPAWIRPLVRVLDGMHYKGVARRIERVIGRIRPDMKIVDVGCGMNSLLAAVKELRGCEGIGVDFKPEVAAYVRDVRKMPCVAGTLEQAKFEDASFDLVTMNEYLEHEPFPRQVLREARRITKPGGHVSIEVPFSDGLPARMFGRLWSQIDAPRHLMHFTKQTISDMLARSGYQVVKINTFQIPIVLGYSVMQCFGARQFGGPTVLDSGVALLVSLPFYLAYPWMDEFMHVVARAV
jgi:ubiquinone/menaquinone biosynthesis C-methylase UbiE